MKICHVSSVHINTDVRIVVKECYSLQKAGFETYFVAKGDSREDNNVHVIGVGPSPEGRIKRMFSFSKKVVKKSLQLDCDLYHLHDPELLRYVNFYKKHNKIVVFDCHEDVPAQIEDKYWIPKFLRGIVAKRYKRYETKAVKKVDAVVAATPHIAELFKNRARIVVDVNNYPQLNDIIFQNKPFEHRDKIVCYTGLINTIRGEKEMVEAAQKMDGTLILAGNASDYPTGLKNVKYTGRFTRGEVNEIYKNSRVGLIVFQPKKNHIDAQPNKMFEYMAAGLPVVSSNFPVWRNIVEKNNCGICVDPSNIDDIAKACSYYLNNPKEAQIAGQNGRKAIETLYNWNNEEKKLVSLYKDFEKVINRKE